MAETAGQHDSALQTRIARIAALETQARLIARTAFPYEDYNGLRDRAYSTRTYRLCAMLFFLMTVASFGAVLALLAARGAFGAPTLVALDGANLVVTLLAAMAITGFMLFVFVSALSLAWVNGGFSRNYATFRTITKFDREARKRLNKISDSDRLKAEAEIRSAIQEGLRNDSLDQFALADRLSYDALSTLVCTRLRDAISAQHNWARVHLIIGLLLGVVGIWLAGVVSVDAVDHAGDSSVLGEKFWTLVSARLGPVLAVQGLWVFFLWSYRRADGEAKFFQNELTTMESKMLAVRLAYDAGIVDEQKTAEIMKLIFTLTMGLLANERHLILRRGEHTIYSEQMREDGRGVQGIFGMKWTPKRSAPRPAGP